MVTVTEDDAGAGADGDQIGMTNLAHAGQRLVETPQSRQLTEVPQLAQRIRQAS